MLLRKFLEKVLRLAISEKAAIGRDNEKACCVDRECRERGSEDKNERQG